MPFGSVHPADRCLPQRGFFVLSIPLYTSHKSTDAGVDAPVADLAPTANQRPSAGKGYSLAALVSPVSSQGSNQRRIRSIF